MDLICNVFICDFMKECTLRNASIENFVIMWSSSEHTQCHMDLMLQILLGLPSHMISATDSNIIM
jgi:hypothetical protein